MITNAIWRIIVRIVFIVNDGGFMSEELIKHTLKTINEMFANGEKINYYTVAEKAEVSRTFLYNHKAIVSKIAYYKKLNALSHEKRIEHFKKENNLLRKRLSTYEDLLIKEVIEK